MSSKLWDLNQSAVFKQMLNHNLPAGITASVTGPTVDMINGDGNCTLFTTFAYISGSGSTTLDAKIQESADGSTGWTDITGASITQITTNATTTPAAGTMTKPWQRNYRYLRMVMVVNGTTSPVYSGEATVIEQLKYTPT